MLHNTRNLAWKLTTLLVALAMAACGGNGGGGGGGGGGNTYTIGGTLTGLGAGLSVTLLNNGGDALALNADGAFTFATQLAGGRTYSVTVGTQPAGQVCTVTNGAGTVGSANVTIVAVTCANTHTIGGTLTGLGAGLSVTLLNNGGDALTLNADGAFTFATAIADGSTYDVSVGTQPNGQLCTVTDGAGTVAAADVTNVSVSCADTYTVGGTLTGLGAGLSITLLNNGGDALTLNADGAFTFATALLDGAAYAVTVDTLPAGQQCTVADGSGTIATADVTNVSVNCAFANVWVWKGGSDLVAAAGVYGTLGTPAPGNTPGARNWNGSWQDPAGNFWIFGGMGCDSAGACDVLNDLWRYDPSTGEWAWMGGSNTINAPGVYGTQGVPSASNIPGAREYMTTWSDAAGDLWLFGGQSTNQPFFFNDLWRYRPSTGEWTWIGGSSTTNAGGVYGTLGVEDPANVPGARYGAIAWVDAAGTMWLFGGYGVDSSGNTLGYMNDLWTLNPANNNWTWRGGSTTFSTIGVYGALGVPAPGNQPGGRLFHSGWMDTVGNMWVFGGIGVDSTGALDFLNDLWRYEPATGNWTWMSGSAVINQIGVYGTQGTPNPANVPGARGGSMVWADSTDGLWIFAGAGLDSTGTLDDLSDLWKYDIATGDWTWVNGSNLAAAAGTYGTLDEPSVNTQPGARDSGTVWLDSQGRTWLFGGAGYDSTGTYDPYGLNDIFQYIP